ncbi:MAG: hypothetical protein EAX96_19890 [Candidatus Lokiarchaeota archaeon]|nr:hypothetical protein [Candidatus Lokiarchaeota archaeon]
MIETHLYGKLRSLVPKSKACEDTILMCEFIEGETFKDFINRFNLKLEDLGDSFIDGKLAKSTDILKDGARVALFPFNMVLLCGGQHIKGHGYTRKEIDIDYY